METTAFSLDSKYLQQEGTILLSGVQALVRLPLDQHRADKQAGLNTATFISGYRGSPLGGLDILLAREKKLLDDHQVVFMPGVNEDLGATAVFGSQLANLLPQPKYDGVLGMWYGKSPGVDRSGDIFKHANFAGVGRYGGVLAVAGDDPLSKSSTLPSHSEIALYDAQMPILVPGMVQEVIEYGRYGFELSRYSGAWVGFKVVTNVADSFETAVLHPITVTRPEFSFNGKPWQHTQNPTLVAPYSIHLEQEIHEGRLAAAKLFAAANDLNRITVRSENDWIGLVAAGKTYYDLREALQQLGLSDADLQQHGIRLLKIGMLYPLEPTIVRQFARGLQEIFVIEEKRGFLELLLRDVLYNLAERPVIVGKQDENDNLLTPGHAELDPDIIAQLLLKRLSPHLRLIIDRSQLTIDNSQLPIVNSPLPTRTFHFCSGCPHNRSTIVPAGSIAGGGIGCHGMALVMDRNTQGITHMGGEGVQWVGASPFTNTPHIFQNLGDGTLFHSGTLAIRQAVAARANITYKILYNSAVAMTGAQPADGAMPVPELTRALQAEGVSKIIVCSHDVDKYPPGTRWATGTEVWYRDRLDEAQQILRDTTGTTVLIYDQPCAADLRRKRSRGQVPTPPRQVFINEAVCEGCGDCGVKSNCLSVFPVSTEFGRKTQIHQSSCNRDYTCLDGDCPAFVTVVPVERRPETRDWRLDQSLISSLQSPIPEPTPKVPLTANIYMMGIGGTGVVTVNQILATAALLDGKQVRSLDQTGLSQKGGPVVSHLRLSDRPSDTSNKIGKGAADAYIVFDVLTGTTEANLAQAQQDKTIAIVSSSQIPTGGMVASIAVHFPQDDYFQRRLEAVTRAKDNLYLDAIQLAENLFGNHLFANVLTIGAAYQAGAIPISAAAIEQAIELNGAAVEKNKQAFCIGRLVVADPARLDNLQLGRKGAQPVKTDLSAEALALVNAVGAEGELRRLLEIRVPELIAYQNLAYARDYTDFVQRVLAAELGLGTAGTPLSEAVARYLFKLMAYKDEYEVARLYLQPAFQETVTAEFGTRAKVTYQLHPPLLRQLGLKRKVSFGRWFDTVYRLLATLKGLRGTAFDIFGYAKVRRVERQLIGEYRAMIEAALPTLSADTITQAVQLAQLPDMIRGYEEVKLANIARFREKVPEIQAGLNVNGW